MGLMRQYVKNIRCGYLMLLAVYTILREVIPLQIFVGMGVLTYGVFGLGLLITIASLAVDRQYLRVFNIPVMLLFLGACVLSVLVNYRYAFTENVKAICWMILFFLLVYPSGAANEKNGYRELRMVFAASVVVLTVLVVVSLPMYLCNVDFNYSNENIIGMISNQGFSNEYMRLWGVFGDPNTAAVYSVVAVIMAVYLFLVNKNIVSRVALAVSVVLLVIFVVLSGSRTAYLALAITCAWCGFYWITARKKTHKRWLLAAFLCAAITAGIGVGALTLIREVLPYVKGSVSADVAQTTLVEIHNWYQALYEKSEVQIEINYDPSQLLSETEPPATETLETEPPTTELSDTELPVTETTVTESAPTQPPVEELDRNDLEDKDISNGRLDKWMDALEIFAVSPVVGASPRGAMIFGRMYCPDNDISQFGVAVHNFLLEILMGTGLVGVAVAIVLLLRAAGKILKISVIEEYDAKIMLCGAVAMNLVCASMFLSDLFFVLTFGGFAFWYCLGCVSRDPQYPKVTQEKKKVLVYGPKDPAGGVEKIVFDYVCRTIQDHEDISFDYLMYGESFSMESALRALGCRVIYLPSRKKNFTAYKKAIDDVFRSTDYIAVWGNYSGLTNIDLLVLAKRYGVPVRIAHSHGSKLYWGSSVMKYVVHILHYFNKYFRLDGYATAYWACSDMAGRFMFPKSVHHRILRMPNAVDTDIFFPDANIGLTVRKALGIDNEALVVGHVARICEVKNQRFLLQVMAEVVKLRPDAKLLFVGDGELRQQVEDEIRRLGLENSVILTGLRKDVPDMLRAMNVYVLTSFSEGLSVSAVEAQATGLPCVMPTSVSPETDLTGGVQFLPLSEPTQVWAQTIIRCAASKEDLTEKIVSGGYDICSAARLLYENLTVDTR